ncbi:MAG: transglutaminase domain-containing protein [Paracoccaceae bacterium]
MTLYSLRLAMRYEFDRPTGAGRQLFRVLPSDGTGFQTVRLSQVSLIPSVAENRQFSDFFGTRVIEAAIPPGLTSLDLLMTAVVDRADDTNLLDISTPLERLAAEVAGHRDVGPASPHHFTGASRKISESALITAFAMDLTSNRVTVRDVVESFGVGLHQHMVFDADATSVDTLPEEAFAMGRGVCQDFAQIMVGGLRSLGVPAAYVAGYLRTEPPPGQPRLTGADAMHAWVRAWAGAEMGWIDYDPTNSCFVRNDHIDVGFGRDYDDVAPVTGWLRLDGRQSGSHSVDIAQISA